MRVTFLIPLIALLIPIAGILFINGFYAQLPQDSITEGIVGQPRNLHPLTMQQNPVDRAVVSLLYRSLLSYDLHGELVSDLASSWEVSDDGRTYTFYLHHDVHWHDGQRVTSDDVVFTAQRHPSLQQVSVAKQDEYTVQFTLSEPYAPFPELLTLPIAPEHISPDEVGLRAMGNGDYMLTIINPAPNVIESLTLERVHGNTETSINTLILRFFNDSDELATAVHLGEVDVFAGDPFEWPGFSTVSTPLRGINYAVYINIARGGLLADIDFRHDLARHTPKEVLVTERLRGRYAFVDGPIHDSWASADEVDEYPYQTVVDTPYEGEFTLVVPRTRDNVEAAEVLQDEWGRLGIDISLEVVETDDLDEKVLRERDFDFLLLGREVGHDPDRYTYWHSTQIEYPGLNITGYKQVRVDKAMEKGRQEQTREARKEHYDLFQSLLAADVPAIYLYQPVYYYTASDRVHGIDLRDVYTPKDRYKSIDSWYIDHP